MRFFFEWLSNTLAEISEECKIIICTDCSLAHGYILPGTKGLQRVFGDRVNLEFYKKGVWSAAQICNLALTHSFEQFVYIAADCYLGSSGIKVVGESLKNGTHDLIRLGGLYADTRVNADEGLVFYWSRLPFSQFLDKFEDAVGDREILAGLTQNTSRVHEQAFIYAGDERPLA